MQQQFIADYVNAAHAANAKGEFAAAADWCRRTLQYLPYLPEAWYNLGVAYRGQGLRNDAITSLEKAAAHANDDPAAQNSVGLQLLELGALPQAERCLRRAVSLAPTFAFARSNLGLLRERQKRLAEAEICHRKAIELAPELASAHANLAATLNAQKKHDDAKEAADRAVELDPQCVEAWCNLGSALQGLRRYAEAEVATRRAIKLAPSYAAAWHNLGSVLLNQRNYREATAASRKAIELDPGYAETWSNLGGTLLHLQEKQEAKDAFLHAIVLDPRLSAAWIGLGSVLLDRHEYRAAGVAFDKLLAFDPDADFCLGYRLSAATNVCDWNAGQYLESALRRTRDGKKAAEPFILFSTVDDPVVHLRAAETFCEALYPVPPDVEALALRPRGDKIRLGYFSPDFREHPVSMLMAELFELHDRERFEVMAFSFGPADDSAMRRRVAAAFDDFIDVTDKSDREAAMLAREFGIDIAIDLAGYTKHCRPGIFAFRAAPVQVSYVGYIGTMGAPYIDYLLADEVIIPEASRRFYSEKIAYLSSYQVNDATRTVSDRVFSRDELGLPAKGFVFCCFNNSYKITPATFDSWMRILKAVEDSVLFLYAANPEVEKNLRSEAKRRGVDPARLIFAGWVPRADYLARYRTADLFLDTLPYNAGTTASDALWAGLPVLTQTGESFASRYAASLLHAIGLPELITASAPDYEALAIELAQNPERLAGIRRKLASNRSTAPLFDTHAFARNIEAVYAAMHARSQAGQSPDHIVVAPSPLPAVATT
jgi:protein O-GlcNAc transferase